MKRIAKGPSNLSLVLISVQLYYYSVQFGTCINLILMINVFLSTGGVLYILHLFCSDSAPAHVREKTGEVILLPSFAMKPLGFVHNYPTLMLYYNFEIL